MDTGIIEVANFISLAVGWLFQAGPSSIVSLTKQIKLDSLPQKVKTNGLAKAAQAFLRD